MRPHLTKQSAACFTLLLALIALTGCRVAKGVVDLPSQAVGALTPRQKKLQTTDLAALQNAVIRTGDEFLNRTPLLINRLERQGKPLPRPEQLELTISFTTETLEIITQPNAIASLIELAAVSTTVREDIEFYWIPEVFGPSAAPLLASLQTLETNAWSLCSEYLTPTEITTMQDSIRDWQTNNVSSRSLGLARFSSAFLTLYLSKQNPSPSSSQGGLLSVIQFDPLAGLDPATRELTQTRLYAERATYLLTKMPELVSMQTELLSYRLTQIPQVQQTLAQTETIAESANRLSQTAESLPPLIQQERTAIVAAFEQQSTNLNSLAAQLEKTLAAGSQMASNLNQTLLTFNQVAARFENTNNPAPTTNSQPFRIQDYTETARELDATAQHLTELLHTFDQTIASTNLTHLTSTATTESQALVDHTTKRILQLAGILSLLVLLTSFVKHKLSRSAK